MSRMLYLHADPQKGIIHYNSKGSFKFGKIPLAGTTASIVADGGYQARGYALSTGLLGSRKDKGTLFVLLRCADGRVEIVEIPRQHQRLVLVEIERINALSQQMAG